MSRTPTPLAAALRTWDRIQAGEAVVVGDSTLDTLSDHFRDSDAPEADRFFRRLVTHPNPGRVGILDAYLATLR